ncbi:MAG: FGGY family carbohydrate kinase [Bacteroidota bacterium]
MSDRLPVDLIFDIGKTNKKLVVFDKQYTVVHQDAVSFSEIADDDGYLGDDLPAINTWMQDALRQILADDRFKVRGINVSGYGASMVHLDEKGHLITPFYNYTKPLPDDFYDRFFERFGDRRDFELAMASPLSGMLNSGFQLFYLQEYKAQLAAKVHHSLHFPQYLSYQISGKMVSDYTSLGCHTGLWDFATAGYHPWLNACELLPQLAPIVRTDHHDRLEIQGQTLSVGVGVHDSSAALLPYLRISNQPFVLLSTGTWSVSLNPFNNEQITDQELTNGCLCYMNLQGQSIKASRVFLGKSIEYQVAKIAAHFNKDPELFKTLRFDPSLPIRASQQLVFHYDHLDPELFGYKNGAAQDLSQFHSFEEAYQLLMDELTNIQVSSLRSCLGKTPIERVYVDGGFSSNHHFTQMLANKLEGFEVWSSSLAAGSSLGAALLLNDDLTGTQKLPVDIVRHESVAVG